jgi:hypothetical protein
MPQAQIHPTRVTLLGPNALSRPVLPNGAIDDFVVQLETIRQCVVRSWN